MKGQPNRLGAGRQHALQGSAIDRSKPLKFRLDDRTICGFAGDTVLSALLASGLDTVGKLGGESIGLSGRFAPAITLDQSKVTQALPMTRTPAVDGAEFYTFGRPVRRLRLPVIGSERRSLRQNLDRSLIVAPWHDQPPHALITTDVIVVGGGVAGVSAALAAARTGARVTLLESASMLGGGARYFGSQEGDETPEETITGLSAEIAASEAITVLLHTEVLAAHSGRVRAHRVLVDGAAVSGEVVDVTAPRIVLATGAIERLPVFPGNRLSRVMTTMEAYQLAERYGVWPGRSAVLATVHSAAYHLPMLLSDAGIATSRIADARTDPQSRFIEYSHAYGITQSLGTVPAHVEPAAKGRGLSITLQLAFEGYTQASEAIPADTLLVCGGWQPDLTLWHMAGGQSRWSAKHHRLEPVGDLPQIALAGSAAGYFSKHACLLSGQDAVNVLFAAPRSRVVELSIDPVYETPDAPTPTALRSEAKQQASYLDAGLNLIQPPDPDLKDKYRWWPLRKSAPSWSLTDQPRPLGIGDVAAGVQLGAIPAESAGTVAEERAVASGDLIDAARLALLPDLRPAPPAPRIPAFLIGRFGAEPQMWIVAPDEARMLDMGALIFLNSDQTDPRQAIGAIIGSEGETVIALVGKAAPQPGDGLILRDQGRAVAIRLVEPFSAAAFGSVPGPA